MHNGKQVENYRDLFGFEEGYLPLNHGSFGACPKAVMQYHFDLQKRMESLTTRFFSLELKPLLIESMKSLARFVNAKQENMVFVRNATTAANAVINSIPWQEGDEIVTNNLIYEACRHLLNHLSQARGVVLRVAHIPFPVESEDQIFSQTMNLVNRKTKLVFLDHITSETATIIPVERICEELRPHNIPVFIDGAHTPGMIPLDLEKLNPDFYTGNCHKWLCAPKGSAFLYVRPDRQKDMIPPTISFFFRKGSTIQEQFFNSFFWTGTAMDYLSCCAVKEAIEYLDKGFNGGWLDIMDHNRNLVLKGRDIIHDILGLQDYTPEEMTGSMVSFRLNSKAEKDPETNADILLLELLRRYKIESFIATLHETDERVLRISAHIYNQESDYVRLGESLKELLS